VEERGLIKHIRYCGALVCRTVYLSDTRWSLDALESCALSVRLFCHCSPDARVSCPAEPLGGGVGGAIGCLLGLWDASPPSAAPFPLQLSRKALSLHGAGGDGLGGGLHEATAPGSGSAPTRSTLRDVLGRRRAFVFLSCCFGAVSAPPGRASQHITAEPLPGNGLCGAQHCHQFSMLSVSTMPTSLALCLILLNTTLLDRICARKVVALVSGDIFLTRNANEMLI
jgi:hypothetical protein